MLIASENIPEGTTVCRDLVHVACPLNECVKKVCARCLEAASGRLELKCEKCSKAFYCSEDCREASMSVECVEKPCGSARSNAVPHPYVCEVTAHLWRIESLSLLSTHLTRTLIPAIGTKGSREGPV